jgi:hypothetical protein
VLIQDRPDYLPPAPAPVAVQLVLDRRDVENLEGLRLVEGTLRLPPDDDF